MGTYRDWLAYQKAYNLAIRVHKRSENFPKEERYSLTDQIRRSTKSVCANMAEAYARRKYERYFISKIYDSLSENLESSVWLSFCVDLGYVSESEYTDLLSANEEIGKLISYMLGHPKSFQ